MMRLWYEKRGSNWENRDRIKDFGVKRIGIFGSVVRGEAKEKSDIDFVVEFERGMATFKNVCGLIDFLEELFNSFYILLWHKIYSEED